MGIEAAYSVAPRPSIERRRGGVVTGWFRWSGATPRARASFATREQSLSGKDHRRKLIARTLAAVSDGDRSDALVCEGTDRVDRSMSSGRSPRVSKSFLPKWPCPMVGLLTFLLLSSCSTGMRRSGIPASAQTALDTATQEIDAGRYEELYNEASDEWRN